MAGFLSGLFGSKEEKANNLEKAMQATKANSEKAMAAGTGQSISEANKTNEGQAVMKTAAELDAAKLQPKSEENTGFIKEKAQELVKNNNANTEARLNNTETTYSGPTVSNTNEGIANAKVGDVVKRADGSLYTITQGDINYAKSQLERNRPDPEPASVANAEANTNTTSEAPAETPADATPEQKQEVEEQVEESKEEIQEQSEEDATDQMAEQAASETGEDKESWKDKIKKIYQMFKLGQIKPGTDAYYMANAIATTAYNIGEQMEKNFRNSLWSHINSGNFEDPEFKKSFREQEKEAELSDKAQKDRDIEANIKGQAAQANFDYNQLPEIIQNSQRYNLSPEEQAKLQQIQNLVQTGQPLSAEQTLLIQDLQGRIENLKAGEERQATAENIANEQARFNLDVDKEYLRDERKAQLLAQKFANMDAETRLKYLDDLMATELKANELANISMAFPGSISIYAKAGIPGLTSAGGNVDIPYATLISVGATLGKTISEVISALEDGDKSVLDALREVGESTTKSKR